jgi:NhaP-type Na+/H+ or K+/H+ antiporter
VVYGLLVLQSGIDAADEIFHLVALTIALSIVLHSSTDVVVARTFDERQEVPAWFGALRRSGREPMAGRPGERD